VFPQLVIIKFLGDIVDTKNNNLKRVIAREGLILLSLSILTSISLLGNIRFEELAKTKFSRAELNEFSDLRKIVLGKDKSGFRPVNPFHYQTIAAVVKDAYPEYANIPDKELAEKVSVKFNLKVSYEENETDKFKKYAKCCDISFCLSHILFT
jgi:hypothetical protein